jgi:hypothetical protein
LITRAARQIPPNITEHNMKDITWEFDLVTTTLVVLLPLIGLYLWSHGWSRRKGKKALPRSKMSIVTTLDRSSTKEGTASLEFFRNEGVKVMRAGLGCSLGPVFAINVPSINPTIMVMDYVLARIILTGPQEGEKAAIMRAANLLHHNVYNAVSKLTADTDREKARKEVAKSFSTTNLRKVAPFIYARIVNVINLLGQAADTETVVDMSRIISRMMMQALVKTSMGFDVVFVEGALGEATPDEAKRQIREGEALDGVLLGTLLNRATEEKARQVTDRSCSCSYSYSHSLTHTSLSLCLCLCF